MRCITDANVWIDLYEGSLLASAFALPDEWATTDLVLAETKRPDADVLRGLGLAVVGLGPEALEEVVALSGTYAGPTPQDLSALLVAKTEGAVLLTGDRALREAAEAEGVEVHGTLWVLDRMVKLGVVTPADAAAGLRAMAASDRRLPRAEVAKRLRTWGRRT